MLNQNFLIVGAIIETLGCFSYFIDTLKGKVKPNRVSFFMWSLAPLIAFAAEIQQGVGLQSLLAFMAGVLPITILLASLTNKKAEWKIEKFDVICGILSLIGIILWIITKTGNVAIFFSILADGLASVPTIKKSYLYPETENHLAYSTTAIFAVITLLTIKQWNFATYAFPIYMVIVNSIITTLILLKLGGKLKLKNS